MKRIIFVFILAVILTLAVLLMTRHVAAQDIVPNEGVECQYDKDAVFYCVEASGCDADPFFNMTVAQMAAELGLPDDNYRPCRLVIHIEDGQGDRWMFTIPQALQYLCWDYRPVCGITGFDYAWAWTSGESGVHIRFVEVWLQRHLPNYVPIAIERSGWDDQSWQIGDTILPVAPGYPPPGTPQPPPYP